MKHALTAAPAAIALLLALQACGGGGGGEPAVAPSGPTAATPASFNGDCSTLATLPVANGAITSATTVAAGTVLSANTLPEHCQLVGQIAPRTGTDGKPYAIGFELRLPKAWNGRFLFQGGGGNDGAIRPALGSPSGGGSLAALGTGGLAQGFAVVSTDGGHQGTDASFGLDAQARTDHAYNAFEKVTVVAKDLINRTYGKAPDKSYFVGCSGGGRQAMLFPQRYASYFDGIAANAPAIKVAREASAASAWSLIGYAAAAPTDTAGKPVISQALSDADLALVSNAVLQRCDALDGAVDGIIHANPAACNFDPALLQCTGAKTESCLTAAQVTALQRDFGGPRTSGGTQIYATWPWDSGIRGADWRRWRLGSSTTSTGNARNETLIVADAMRLEFFTPAAPGFDYMQFDFDTDVARMDAYAALYNTTSTDLAAYKARGGKMLIVHGTSDPIFSANDSIDYYERLASANGGLNATRDFARLYLVPGMNHCAASGGPATDLYDSLLPLVDWVEKGTEPDRIIARAGAGTPWPGRTRPLCPYPQQARYRGAGNIEDAASFSCQ